MDKINRIITITLLLVVFFGGAVLILGCMTPVRTTANIQPETQLTRQEVKDVVTDVLNQSSQNGLFNFQMNEGTMSGFVGLGLLVYLIGSLGKGGLRYVSHKRRLREVDQWDANTKIK